MMNNLAGVRASTLPLEHLEAELLAAPLASKAAFANAIPSLDPTLESTNTAQLWRETENSMLSQFPGLPVDELIARRDRIWFPDAFRFHTQLRRSIPLTLYLEHGAAQMLDSSGRVDRADTTRHLNQSHSDFLGLLERQRRHWRWLTFALPPELLKAVNKNASERQDPQSQHISYSLSERGFAETHMHIGACLPFNLLWSMTQFELAQSTATETMFCSPGAEFNEGRDLAPWLLRASICRLLLAAFLCTRSSSEKFKQWLNNYEFNIRRKFGYNASCRIGIALADICGGSMQSDASEFTMLREDYASMVLKTSPVTSRLSKNELHNMDPMSDWFKSGKEKSPDFIFTQQSIHYLKETDHTDRLFTKLFWQLVRLRVHFYRHVVQRPMTPGLQWFIRTFQRLAPAKKNIAIETYLENAFESSGPGLRSLEFRTTPGADLASLFSFIKRVDKAARKHNNPTNLNSQYGRTTGRATTLGARPIEVGIVFHFSRIRGPSTSSGLPAAWGENSYACPYDSSNLSNYRYSSFYYENCTYAAALANLVTSFPRTLEILRGVDLCSDEIGVPLWVSRILIEHVKKAARSAAEFLPANSTAHEQRLRITVHVGEDFVHLLSGMRRIGEAVEFLPLIEGDRIGHGIALGVDAASWANRTRYIPVTLEARLMDLIWAWRLAMRPTSSDALKLWLPWLREQLDTLSQRIFGNEMPLSPALLDNFQRALHNTKELKLAGFPSGPAPQISELADDKVRQLMVRWMCDCGLFMRAQSHIEIDVQAEIPLLVALQKDLRRTIGRLGIVIEVNPSSNLLIGHLGNLSDHPLWYLKLPQAEDGIPPIRICIGSDDPITFATNIRNEYQLVCDAMSELGYSAEEIDIWIDRVRQTSLDSRFTIPRSEYDLTVPFTHNTSPLALY